MSQPHDASAGATPESGAWGWVARRQTKLVWMVLVLAAVLRLITFAELSDSPAKTLNGFADSDMAFFNAWSIQLAKGNDVLSDGGLRHPIHTWHRQVAAEHLSVHPELFADRVGGRSWDELQPLEQLNEQALLWNEWYGDAFHQEPLYPYLMAVIYGLFGHAEGDRIWLIQLLQILVGVVTIALLYQVTMVYFGSQVALVTAVLVTLYAPLLHYEFFLLRSALICFTGVLLVYLAERYRSRESLTPWLGYGILCGLATALKMSFSLYALLMCAYMVWPRRRELGVTSKRVGAWAGGVILALSPIFIRNLLVGAPLLGITSIGPVTFAVTNHAEYVANTNWSVDAAAVAVIMGQSGGGFLSTISATLATHDSVLSYVGLLWAKFCQVWQWLDVPNNTNFYMAQKSSTVLAMLPVTFTVLASLGLVGLGVAFLRRRLAIPLLFLIGIGLVQMVGFYVLSRFRLPMCLALAPFSALGLISIGQWIRGGHRVLAAGGVVAALLFALWIQRPLSPDRPVINSGDYALAYLRYYGPEWQEAYSAGDWQRSADLMRHAIDTRPDYLDGISLSMERIQVFELQAVQVYAEVYKRYAASLDSLGHIQDAIRIRTRANVLATILSSVAPGTDR